MTGAVETATAKTFEVTSPKNAGEGSLRKAVERADRRPGRDRVVLSGRLRRDVRLREDIRASRGLTLVGRGEDGPGLFAVAPRGPNADWPSLRLYVKGDRSGRYVVRDLKLDSVALSGGDELLVDGVTSSARPHPRQKYALSTAIWLYGEEPNTVRNSTISGGWYDGIVSYYSDDARIENTEVTGQEHFGIEFDHASGTVASSRISGVDGPGIVTNFSHADIVRSTVADNDGSGIVGGYYGGVTIEDTTVTGNSDPVGAGVDVSDYGAAEIRNSTISGNVAERTDDFPAKGGGVFAGGDVDVTASTITGNRADQGGGIFAYGGEGVIVESSIVAGNEAGTGPDCHQFIPYPPGPWQPASGGGNVFGPAGCGSDLSTDISTADPGLGPLADNGGPTRTHALLPGSPAIDHGLDVGLATDQRGVQRHDPDSGAFELE